MLDRAALEEAEDEADSSHTKDDNPVAVQLGAAAVGHPQAEQSLQQSTLELVESTDDATQTPSESSSCEDDALSGPEGKCNSAELTCSVYNIVRVAHAARKYMH